jgi:hypothetical protein
LSIFPIVSISIHFLYSSFTLWTAASDGSVLEVATTVGVRMEGSHAGSSDTADLEASFLSSDGLHSAVWL